MKSQTSKKRRALLSMGILAGAGIAVGSFFGRLIRKRKEETIQLMTADGKLVEVPRKFIPRSKHNRKVSNTKLKQWMDAGRKHLKLAGNLEEQTKTEG